MAAYDKGAVSMRMTVKQIADKLGVSPQRVYQWLQQGLKHTRERTVGQQTRIVVKPDDLADFLTNSGEWLFKA